MKISVLVENTACRPIGCAHGLSLYIETRCHHILFDAGPDGALLLKNAEQLGIDLASVDIAILSHGHYDHAGGMAAFMGANKTAKLFMHKNAGIGHFATEYDGLRYIGVDPVLTEKYADRIEYTDGVCTPDSGLLLFSDISGDRLLPDSNSSLLEERDGVCGEDRFSHEQDLLISEDGAVVLVAGCAHRGIVNIIARAAELCGREPDYVFSGLHLTNPGMKTDEPENFVRSVGYALKKTKCTYFTGHCTGETPYLILKDILKERIEYMHGGANFQI